MRGCLMATFFLCLALLLWACSSPGLHIEDGMLCDGSACEVLP